MPLSWDEVVQQPDYIALTPDQKIQAKSQYFKNVIAPDVEGDGGIPAREQFMKYEPKSVIDLALDQYPAIKRLGVVGKMSLGGGNGYLEFWPPGESGEAPAMRPKDIPMDKPGVEVYDQKTRPIDVLGDVVSHYMVNEDPKIASYYKSFQDSLTDEQRKMLQSQYAYAQQHETEKRSYDDWAKAAGLPAYFRGYAFQQWPAEFNATHYTADQRGMFDDMMKYLTTPENEGK